MTEERVEYNDGLNQLESLQVERIHLKFLIGALIEYISESTDFWDYHDDIGDMFPLVVDWAKKIESGLHEAPLPPNAACTCPNEWAKARMKLVEELIQKLN